MVIHNSREELVQRPTGLNSSLKEEERRLSVTVWRKKRGMYGCKARGFL